MQPNGVADRDQWQADGPLDSCRWIPLVTLAIEGFGVGIVDNSFDQRYERLRYDLRDEVICDDIGIPHIPRTLAATMIRERAQALTEQKARIDAQKARFDAKHNAELARIRGMGRPGGDGLSAYEAMLQAEEYEPDYSTISMAFGVSHGGSIRIEH